MKMMDKIPYFMLIHQRLLKENDIKTGVFQKLMDWGNFEGASYPSYI